MDLPVVARLEAAYAILALDENRERRCLHAADRGLVEPAFLRVESRHGTRAVYADEPVRFGAAHRRVGQWAQLAVPAQFLETFLDGALCHRLQPQALDRLLVAGMLSDISENQLAFPARVACVYHPGQILAT